MFTRGCWLLAVLLLIGLNLVSGVPFWKELLQNYENNAKEQSSPMDMPRSVDQVLVSAFRGRTIESLAGRSLGPDMVSDGLDMVMTKKQKMRLRTGIRARNDGQRTVATLWTNGVVPYTIQANAFNRNQTDWINRSIRNWERYTCIDFRPATRHDVNKVKIVTGEGCYAALGMQGGEQVVNLATNGCFWTGTVEHELGHALGLIHEHQRNIRDRYLKIDYFASTADGVDSLTKYARDSEDKLGLGFDYHSIMHYQTTAFSADGYSTTIYTRDPTKQDVIGMILVPSYTDVLLINMMYNCSEKHRARCPNAPRCRAGCFLHKNCRCFCERDMPQEVCQDEQQGCPQWALQGDCHSNPGFMHHYCRKSCNICNDDGSVPQLPCLDGDVECPKRAQRGECERNPSAALRDCRKSCGLCTEGEDYSAFWESCRDLRADCRQRVEQDECDTNPKMMLKECRRACDFCPQDMDQVRRPGPCEDYDSVCVYRATNGMCDRFYNLFSLVDCRHACRSCNITLPADCVDLDPDCKQFALNGECDSTTYAAFMNHNCRMSCDICGGRAVACEDGHRDCPHWKRLGHCSRQNVRDLCNKTCGVC